jgi:hypothetical protein
LSDPDANVTDGLGEQLERERHDGRERSAERVTCATQPSRQAWCRILISLELREHCRGRLSAGAFARKNDRLNTSWRRQTGRCMLKKIAHRPKSKLASTRRGEVVRRRPTFNAMSSHPDSNKPSHQRRRARCANRSHQRRSRFEMTGDCRSRRVSESRDEVIRSSGLRLLPVATVVSG